MLSAVERGVVVDTDGGDVVSLGGVSHYGDVGHVTLSIYRLEID